MVKPEWGTKRICHNCGARFYDLHRDPIVCPKCGTTFDPEALLRSRRSRSAIVSDIEKPSRAKAPAAAKKAVAEAEELETPVETEEAAPGDQGLEEVESAEEEYEEEEETEDSNVLLEDASELGDDNVDDVIDVEGSDEDSR